MKSYLISIIGAMALSSTAYAEMNEQQIQKTMHDYLIKNPAVIVQALQSYQQTQMQDAQKTMQKTQTIASRYANELFHNAADPVAGNANGKVTIVDFFDYQCPHCVSMTPVLEGVMKSNSVRVVFKEFPIRGPVSELASKAALAAKMQGKYFEMHKALMAGSDHLSDSAIESMAKSLGLNMDKFNADRKSTAISDQIKANYKLAQSLLLMGTPAFFIAKTDVTASAPASAVVFVPGQVDQAQLEGVIGKIN